MKVVLIVSLLIFIDSTIQAQSIDSSNYYSYNQFQSDLESGKSALNFVYTDEKGEKVTLDSLKGKVVYLVFGFL